MANESSLAKRKYFQQEMSIYKVWWQVLKLTLRGESECLDADIFDR